ncbi:hypothetical protein PsYK624_057340 [Phanerochaete sordida]|uniref:C3H1-type domain-containing protein n=1 Tax=Phanerochaete sordida TaxID=48140 RepID=A0A9P3G852_9APHY|nr:hypothetical protein PsYK624_057340 [Phanerochaete sordida]
MAPDAKYTRQYCICRNFTTDGVCTRPSCQFSHTLLDTARIAALVGEFAPCAADEKVHFLIEYTKYSAMLDDVDADEHKWRMRLLAGGRATLCEAGLGADAAGGSVSVQPTYPVKGQAREAGAAIDALERKVFGRSHPPDPVRWTLCKQHITGACRQGAACRYSHTLFDTHRVDALLAAAVREHGYGDYRPLVEAECVRPAGAPALLWRVTLRCVVGGYQQKAAPQPVVVTAPDLNTAFRLLEGQFAASTGSPLPATPSPPFSGHRRHSTATPRPARGHARQRSTPNATRTANPTPATPRPAAQHTSSAPADPQQSFSEAAGTHDPPPPYHDAVRGDAPPPHSSHSSKRAL